MVSGNAQFDLHPDAESLNAFAEQMLVGHERERMVAHLAVCSRCREVVFLAQEANGEEPVAMAAAAPRAAGREPWFRNWRLAWVPVGALAVGITVAYLVHVRRAEPPIQTARVANEAGPASGPQQAPSTVANDSEKSPAMAKKAAPAFTEQRQDEATPKPAAPPTSLNEPMAPKENAPGANGGNMAELKSAPEGSEAERQKVAADVFGETQGLVAKKAGSASADKVDRAPAQAVMAGAPMMQAEVVPPPAPKTAPNMRIVGTSRALYVAGLGGLPSGQVAVSSAIGAHKVLALDKGGGLFLSADAGAHWESIGRQWSGRAVAVRTQAELKAAASPEAGTPRDVFELVNDQGHVWVSTDGRSWEAK